MRGGRFAQRGFVNIGVATFALGTALLQTPAHASEALQPEQSREAPSEGASAQGATDIVVTARRKLEDLQDVPMTVNAITASELAQLNIRSFEEISAIVPGLAIGGVGNATIRGVSFNNFVSGFNGTVEFYLNDLPGVSDTVFGQQFDVGQIEVLRGPQGTLRGRSTPSGSITVTTRRPDLGQVDGYVSLTGTNIGGINAQAAVGIPIIADVLGVRLAGLVDENEGSRVERYSGSQDPFNKIRAGRISVRFDPTSNLRFNAVYERRRTRGRSYTQVESLQVIDPLAAAGPAYLTGADRAAVQDVPGESRNTREHLNWQAEWAFGGQRLNYVGGINKSVGNTLSVGDVGNFFGPTAPAALNGRWGSDSTTTARNEAHELRLSSADRLFGMVDYVVGLFSNVTTSDTRSVSQSASFFPATASASFATSPLLRNLRNRERSAFGNLTLHLGEATEFSAGLRYIDFHTIGSIRSGPNLTPIASQAQDLKTSATIYMASIKHRFNDDLMVYALTGSSWRPEASAVGNPSISPSALELQFTNLPAETSQSYEVGFRSDWLDKRLRVNVSAYYQRFKNYPFRSATGQFYVSTILAGNPPAAIQQVSTRNFVAAVPVDVYGLEGEIAYSDEHFNISANASYSKGKIKNGLVPCNDYFPRDGIPDTSTNVPNVSQILSTGSTLSACRVNYRASQSPLWNASIQAEYRLPILPNAEGFLRGLTSLSGHSLNDPLNRVDDVNGFGLLNLYTGLRSRDGSWEVSFYGKNITNTLRILSRSQAPLVTSYRLNGTTSAQGITAYRSITVTSPREFGINVRYAFGR